MKQGVGGSKSGHVKGSVPEKWGIGARMGAGLEMVLTRKKGFRKGGFLGIFAGKVGSGYGRVGRKFFWKFPENFFVKNFVPGKFPQEKSGKKFLKTIMIAQQKFWIATVLIFCDFENFL